MQRKTYVIEALNGVGLYLSASLAERNLRYLSEEQKQFLQFDNYSDAQNYIFCKYGSDTEIDLENFSINRTLFRDVSERYNFYVQSREVIGFGINEGMSLNFRKIFRTADIIEVGSTKEAEYCARCVFAEEYGRYDFYYAGPLLPGESLSFAEMVRYNQLNISCIDMPIKIRGISITASEVLTKCKKLL